jgi:hypothetical protein
MRVRWLVVITAVTCAGPVRADWTIDKPFRYASVVSKDGKAKLVVSCPTVTPIKLRNLRRMLSPTLGQKKGVASN